MVTVFPLEFPIFMDSTANKQYVILSKIGQMNIIPLCTIQLWPQSQNAFVRYLDKYQNIITSTCNYSVHFTIRSRKKNNFAILIREKSGQYCFI